MKHTAVVVLGCLLLMAIACNGPWADTPEADTPEWTALDAKALLRDFLLSRRDTENFEYNARTLAMAKISTALGQWESVYEGDGWWRVSGPRLG